MTKTAFNTHQDLSELSDAEMLEIAYQLNDIEPSTGGVMPEAAAEWAINVLGPLSGFAAFTVLTVGSIALILAAPTIMKEFRNFWSKPKSIRNKA